jgi:molybdopterin-guanine dinucleotide biosynthesis protein A
MGSDKALMELDGEPLVAHLVATLATCCDEVLLVGGDPARFAHLGLSARWVPDGASGSGPLGGILGALEAARHDSCLVVACDMPFVTPDLLAALAAQPHGYRVLAYSADEPLLAIYTRACVEPLRTAIASGNLAARQFLDGVDASFVSTEILDSVDPEHRGAANLNTPDDLAALRPR